MPFAQITSSSIAASTLSNIPSVECGHVHGRAEVRSYWSRQWTMIDPHVEPVAFAQGREGEVVVEVHQLVRDLKGNLLADKMVSQVFRIENGLIKSFDIQGA